MIKIPVYFTRFSRKSDKSCNLTFETQEITSQELANIDEHYQQFGWLLFAENASEKDLPSEDAEEDGISSNERLRRRLFVYWNSKIKTGDFEVWRKQQLDKIGQSYLDKLN